MCFEELFQNNAVKIMAIHNGTTTNHAKLLLYADLPFHPTLSNNKEERIK
jgi:hypothetical protein